MGYAAYTGEDDHLDRTVHEVIAAAGGDTRAAILALVRRQHEHDSSVAAGYVWRQPRSAGT